VRICLSTVLFLLLLDLELDTLYEGKPRNISASTAT
jgi:hypothetical protein